jgi:NAD(P)-dependent dehydrogenase (short-subunit alcohol dehydrogenase family)
LKLIEDAGSEGMFVRSDISNEKDVKLLVEKTVENYGRLDYAFNNAAIHAPMVALVDESSDDFDNVMDVNVKGVWLSMKYEIPQMLKNGGGAIVNMSSGVGIVAMPQMAINVASKHAVLGLTKSAALEYAKSGIRINAMAPGLIETEMVKGFFEEKPQFMEKARAMHPIGRLGKPEEIANAVVWLCSDKASFVTGHTMIVDGGQISR